MYSFCPPELPRGSPPVTVHAANLALFHLKYQFAQWSRGTAELRDCRFFRFRIDMVELQNPRVSLAAVYARRHGEMIGYKFAISNSVAPAGKGTTGVMGRSVLCVVLATICAHAWFAIRGAPAAGTFRKRFYIVRDSAFRAQLRLAIH
jgi:hypothetical protein